MRIKFDWELIYDEDDEKFNLTYRAKVIGGWIVRHYNLELYREETSPSSSMVFIPDINHDWKIN